MTELNSVSNTVEPGDAIELAEVREVIDGSPGSEPGRDNPFDRLLVTGKETLPPKAATPTGTRTVIGTDERVRILETRSSPWRMICALNIESASGSFVGTGALIGPKTVLTAGHCVFHKSLMGGWAKRITVVPGRNGADFPFGSSVSRNFSSLDVWTERQDPDFDVGCIHLTDPIGNVAGTFGLATLPESELKNARLNLSGYPADRGGGEEQYFHSDRVTAVGPKRVFYEIDTFGGQSGAPVWIYPGEDKTKPTQVAIHAYGLGGTPQSMATLANSAPRITPELLTQIKAWLAADGA